MSSLQLLLFAAAVLGATYGLVQLGVAIRTVRRVPVLEPSPLSLSVGPRGGPRSKARAAEASVSVIVPACDEAATLEAAMRSRLEDPDPAVEWILVDDRSRDATGDIAERLAASDRRVRSLHVGTLPEGWLGKVHALHVGVGAARGEWLLFSDADVHLRPGALRDAIAFCEAERADVLALVPELRRGTFLLDAVLALFLRFVWGMARAWAIPDPRSRAAAGCGAFTLVRRSAFERTPGFEWLRMEQRDDAALGDMLKRAGARCFFANGARLASVQFYGSVPEMARGMEKVVAGTPLAALLAGAAFLVAVEAGPWLALAGGGVTALVGAAGAGATLAATLVVNRWMRRGLTPAVLGPVGGILFAALLVRAALLRTWRGGVLWRGTLYPTEELRAGARFKPF